MNKYCWYCGNELNNNVKKCDVCGADTFKKRVNVEEREKLNKEMCAKENRDIVITILLFLASFKLSPLIFVFFIIMLVRLRNKYLYSKNVNKLIDIFNVFIIISIMFIICFCVGCGIIHPGY